LLQEEALVLVAALFENGVLHARLVEAMATLEHQERLYFAQVKLARLFGPEFAHFFPEGFIKINNCFDGLLVSADRGAVSFAFDDLLK